MPYPVNPLFRSFSGTWHGWCLSQQFRRPFGWTFSLSSAVVESRGLIRTGSDKTTVPMGRVPVGEGR